jgi:ABC-type branched-subunit amino acid transport system ATPase component/ABC-type branched-subunit amino acid transport system permease subunit
MTDTDKRKAIEVTSATVRESAPKWHRTPLRGWAVVVAVLAVLGYLFSQQASDYAIFLASTVAVIAIAAVGQEWLIGRAGQISLGGAALLAIGAYTTAFLQSVPVVGTFPVPILISGLVGAVVGLIIGLPALRLKGFYLLLSTLALQYIIQFIGSRLERSHPAGFAVNPIAIGSIQLGGRNTFLLLCAVLLIVCWFLFNLHRNAPGRIWASLKESEIATATMGVSATRWKLLAFVGSSAITAGAGSLYGYVTGLISYQAFSLTLALSLLVMVFLGGVGSMSGAIVAAALVELLPTGLQRLSHALPGAGSISTWINNQHALLDNAIYGLALAIVLLYAPGGLTAIGRALRDRLRALLHRRRSDGTPAAAPSTLTPVVPATSTCPTAVATTTEAPDGESPLLVVRGLSVRYPTGALGLSDVSLDVPAGRIAALVGRNGAGKTSAVRAVAGFPRSGRVHLEGTITFDGHDILGLAPAAAARAGISLVPERDKVFPTLTVQEHLYAVGLSRSEVAELIDRFPSLHGKAKGHAGLLSGGQRQTLALAMALARRPRLLLVDEMSLGLAPIAIRALIVELRQIREQSPEVGILVVDQALDAIGGLADRVYVLENGRLTTSGPPDLLRKEEVRAAIIGS